MGTARAACFCTRPRTKAVRREVGNTSMLEWRYMHQVEIAIVHYKWPAALDHLPEDFVEK